ncbi:MAG: HNH endonuclease [Planctomycetes bacterium]|nr:HNH endonuclease [Planctomycetota bacterium]
MSDIPVTLREQVIQRARGRCEYCLIDQDDVYLTHELDQVIAEKHGGASALSNLALACFFCNRYKGSDIASLDPDTQQLTPLLNPRTHVWSQHFRLEGSRIVPLGAVGRATAGLLQLNHPDRLIERRALIALGRYPR